MGDFYGFSFNGHHSADLNLVRVSDGSRYNDLLTPSFQDKTVQVPGGDGTYFFDSYYTEKPFSIDVAFDNITEANLREIRNIFNGKEVGELIFDEAPYKAYWAKVQSPPQLNYICFDEKRVINNVSTNVRIYKGEGTIQFICYYPFAHSVHKYLNEYDEENKDEWKEASGMLETNMHDGFELDVPYLSNDVYKILVFNPGDMPADFRLYLTLHSGLNGGFYIRLGANYLQFSDITKEGSNTDSYICINTKTNLVEGCDENYNPTGRIYNFYIAAGDFFKIPKLDSAAPSAEVLSTDITTAGRIKKIEYDYLYY